MSGGEREGAGQVAGPRRWRLLSSRTNDDDDDRLGGGERPMRTFFRVMKNDDGGKEEREDVADGRENGQRSSPRGANVVVRGRWQRSRHDNEYNEDDEDDKVGGSPWTSVTSELAARLHPAGIPYASEASPLVRRGQRGGW